MWNKILILLLLCLLPINLYAADQKITALTADTTPTTDDLVATVDDVAGTPTTKKATLANLSKGLTVTSMLSACTDAQVLGGNVAGTGVECQADANTTYTAGGTLLQLGGTAFSLKEGTLTTTKGCKYVSGTGLVCDQDYLTSYNETDPTVDSSAEIQAIIGAGVYQASDADLTTYAGIAPSANAQTLLGETFAQMQASLSIDDLITLSGVAEGSVNLATFTGATIADNLTIKAALQSLETAVEGKQASDADLTTWAGITPGANVGTFLATPSSANLLAAITDETGTGLAVFNISPTFATSIIGSYLTASEILITDASKNIVSAAVATYPSLTELTYVKGVTSAIQTQLNAKDAVTTAGRSLTRTTNDFAADAELYTDTKCIHFEDPTADDDFKSIWFAKNAVTLTSIWAESDQTVTFMLQVDDGSPADVDSVDLAPAAGTAEDTSLDGDATMAAGDRLDLAITSVANTPTWCSICFTFTRDD